MSRPTRIEIDNGTAAWDTVVNDDFTYLFDRPLAIAEHAGDESDLEATFPAASYDRCLIWVDHSTDGWTIYFSDGAIWDALSTGGGPGGSSILVIESISAVGTIADATTLAVLSGTTYTATLPAAATVGAGWILYAKKTASGNITLDGNASETIDGSATYVLRYTNQAVLLVSNGTNWLILAEVNHRGQALAQESISGAATVGDFTDVVLASGTTYTITLPAAATFGQGRLLRVKRTSSGNITLDGNSSETIDGATTFLMDVALMSITLYCDGSNWHIV